LRQNPAVIIHSNAYR
jgi:hypothetical protein